MRKIRIRDLVWSCICLILILCFFVGYFVYDSKNASDILSGASTAVSIVLSLVAILYTMIEGASSTNINQETKNQLSNIGRQLKDVNEKLSKLQKLNDHIHVVVPQLDRVVQDIEKTPNGDNIISDDVKQRIDKLKRYIDEDIDD